MISGTPPTAVAMTGLPAIIASWITTGDSSSLDGTNTASHESKAAILERIADQCTQ
jgi:hypothetical protein